MVFAASIALCDAHNHAIIFMITPCTFGAIPLALIMTKELRKNFKTKDNMNKIVYLKHEVNSETSNNEYYKNIASTHLPTKDSFELNKEEEFQKVIDFTTESRSKYGSSITLT